MDVRWEEAQRAFQARVLTAEDPDLALRPYRTFLGTPTITTDRRAGRIEQLIVVLVIGSAVVTGLLAFGAARELAAVAASFTGGIVFMTSVSPRSPSSHDLTPLLAVYAPSVLGGARPSCVTRISHDEFSRLGVEGFGTVVGTPRPGSTFGLFVDDHLVWPRTPPRGPVDSDPGFGAA